MVICGRLDLLPAKSTCAPEKDSRAHVFVSLEFTQYLVSPWSSRSSETTRWRQDIVSGKVCCWQQNRYDMPHASAIPIAHAGDIREPEPIIDTLTFRLEFIFRKTLNCAKAHSAPIEGQTDAIEFRSYVVVRLSRS